MSPQHPPPPDSSPAQGADSQEAFAPQLGWCAEEVQRELPGLALLSHEVNVGRAGPLNGTSPADISSRLRELSNRLRGAAAVGMRREPIPVAYRIFFRHIGLDPETARTPIEAAVLERMKRGGFLSEGLLADVLTIALIDTGVPVWALDADAVEGPLGIRASGAGERLGRSPEASELPPGRLVIADASAPLAVLFGELAPGHEPGARSRRLVLFALQVAGVPDLYVEEALWMSCAALESS
jgi:DNA/RNA-binding domain of Phe-tRNA-synthetase-like protein